MKPDTTTRPTTPRKMGTTGVAWRIGATAGLVGLCVLTTVRGASGAFDAVSLPVATLTGQNGIISGTTRMMGNRFLLYNGTRLESMAQTMEVNFERGGSMTMCPRSQLQILTANQNAGMMLAFQSGGAQMPFPLRMGDEVITPDWRVELTSDARKGDMGIVQVVTNRHGDLCLQGNSQVGAYFRVTQLIGDESFRVAGGQSERFVDGKMETSSDGCGCNAEFVPKKDGDPSDVAPAVDSAPASPSTANPILVADVAAPALVSASSRPVGLAEGSQMSRAQTPAASTVAASLKPKKQRPQDVAGYVSSFVHRLFGR
jgi:hypothetical protein